MNAVQGPQPPHRPVLYQETIQYLTANQAKRFLDCTAGAGGHSEACCSTVRQTASLSLWI